MGNAVLVLAAIDVVHLVVTLAIGGVIGWVASIVMKTNAQMGLVGNVVVGIGGALLGGWLAPMVGIGAAGTLGAWLVALGGAVLLIVALRFLGVLR